MGFKPGTRRYTSRTTSTHREFTTDIQELGFINGMACKRTDTCHARDWTAYCFLFFSVSTPRVLAALYFVISSDDRMKIQIPEIVKETEMVQTYMTLRSTLKTTADCRPYISVSASVSLSVYLYIHLLHANICGLHVVGEHPVLCLVCEISRCIRESGGQCFR